MQNIIYRLTFAMMAFISLSLFINNMKACAQDEWHADTVTEVPNYPLMTMASLSINLEYQSLNNDTSNADHKEPESLTMLEIFGPQYALRSNLPKRDQWWVNFEKALVELLTLKSLKDLLTNKWSFGKGWQMGTGQTLRCDLITNANSAWSIPVGIGIAKELKLGSEPVKLAFEFQGTLENQEKFEPVWLIELKMSPAILNR